MSRFRANAALVFIALVMGSTFVIVKQAVRDIDPVTFLALRFGIASIVLAISFRGKLTTLRETNWSAGITIGLWLAAGFLLQTIGLTSTSASKAGFITGLSVVMVPLIGAVWLSRRPSAATMFGVVSAAAGMGLLCLGDNLQPSVGDLFVLGCAFAFAMHIVCIGEVAQSSQALPIAMVQLFVTALVCLVGALLVGSTPLEVVLRHSAAILFMALVPSALVLTLQVYVQRVVSATNTALVLSLEPVFAAIFGAAILGEELTQKALLGALLILSGMVAAELRPRRFSRRPAISA